MTRRIAVGAARWVALGAAIAIGGCASDEEYRRQVYGDPRAQMAMRGPVPSRQVEVEDDGLPSQVAPAANRKIEPDDPNEPFSPNYGRAAAAQADVPVEPSARGQAPRGPAKVQDAYQPPIRKAEPVLRGPAVASWSSTAGWRQVVQQAQPAD